MAATVLPDYQYTPLTPGSRVFRAIHLLRPERSWPAIIDKGTLRLRIEEIDVDAGRPYECLSYTWGVTDGQVPDRQVIVEAADGQRSQLRIHRPLEAALLQFCEDGSGGGGGGPLFVDQICLDQSNDAEKADQVPLMQDIYAKCARTVVWLGPSTRLSDQYFDFVHELSADGTLSRLMGPNRGHFLEVFDAVMDRSIATAGAVREDVEALDRLLARHANRFPFRAMQDVFERPWFSRLWIIQEVCLPPSVTIVCGSRALCFDCFRGGGLFFSTYSTYVSRYVDRRVSKASLAQHWRLFELSRGFIQVYQERRAIHVSGRRQSALDTVLRYSVDEGTRKIGASRAEDRIYGLMGLVAADDRLRSITVRYHDVAGLYTEFAALALQENMDVLCYSQFPKSHADLPSWVPDWAMSLRIPHGHTNMGEPRFAAGMASGHSPQAAAADLATGCLLVRGVVVDRITQVGERELDRDVEFHTVDQIDDRTAKLFLDEVGEFLKLAAAIPENRFSQFNPDEDRRADAEIRLADRGLSERYLQPTMAAAQIRAGLRAAKAQVSRVGQKQLDADEQVRSFRLDRIFQTVGIVPWYWVPAGESDVCHAMATQPVATSLRWAQGAALFATDVAGLCLASWVTVGFSHLLRLRRRYTRMALLPSRREETLRRHGLEANVHHSEAVSAFNDFMLKNRGQRLCVTEGGHVGLGPRDMQRDDVVVVLYGGTVPHVLRRRPRSGGDGHQGQEEVEEEEEEWSYLGEAYCDGIMDGELLGSEVAGPSRSFRIR